MKSLVALVALAALMTIAVEARAQTLTTATLNDPPWLLLNLGKRAFENKNFGQALEYFRTSIDKGGTTPEAEMWIGRVFEEEGELDLAENQYARALSNSSQFEIPGEATAIRYDLARIYYNTNQYGKYEVTLKKIVAGDKEFSDPKEAFTRRSMVRVLKNDGLDKLLVLYRLHDKSALAAHSQLGEFYYRTGRYSDSILNLTFSTITMMTVAIDAVRAQAPDYEFDTVDAFLTRVRADPRVSGYLSSSRLFRDLYYLSSSLYADGAATRAASIWRTIVRWSPKDVWYRRAQSQLQKPHIEPIMNIGG